MVTHCQQSGWHDLFRICAEHTCEQWSSGGRLLPTCRVSDLVNEPGKLFYGHIRLWQEDQIETNLSACWEPGEEEALLVISDLPAGRKRLNEYRLRWRVEATFQDAQKSWLGLGKLPCSSPRSCGSDALGSLSSGLVACSSGRFLYSSWETRSL
jgi:hypothetical protein